MFSFLYPSYILNDEKDHEYVYKLNAITSSCEPLPAAYLGCLITWKIKCKMEENWIWPKFSFLFTFND